MHELVKNEKKKERRARPLLQTRTGLNALSDRVPLTEKERSAARRAAMAQLPHRRPEPRSLMVWGNGNKAIIKRNPDGSVEIIVSQTLTPEQENYEFPPKSRFLKKLATSPAEQRRLSEFQDSVVPSAPASLIADPTPAPSYQSFTMNPTTMSTKMKQPDQLSLQEYFSKKENRSIPSKANMDRVNKWRIEVERSSKTLLNNKKYQHLNPVKPSPTPSSGSNKIQFKSDAGKKWANITSNISLLPPDDTCRKHYVPRRLLNQQPNHHHQMQYKPYFSASSRTRLDSSDEENDVTEAAASTIRQIWKDYQNITTAPSMIENQVGIAAMATTGQRTPIAGMVHIVQRLHNQIKVQRQKSHDRMAKLEMLLKEETKKRQEAEETMKHFYHENSKSHEKEKVYQSLMNRVNELSVRRDGPLKAPAVPSTTIQKRRTLVPTNNGSSSSKPTASSTKNSNIGSSKVITKVRTSSLANAGIIKKSTTTASAASTPPLASTQRRRPTVPISRSKK